VDELISPSHVLNDPILSGSQIGPKLYKRRVVEFTTVFPDQRNALRLHPAKDFRTKPPIRTAVP